jgi:hypothetical protein
MPDNNASKPDDLKIAALDALADFKADAITREKEKEDRLAQKKKHKTLKSAVQALLLLASIVVIAFQTPTLISAIQKENKPHRHGTFDTDKRTDACIQALWNVSALLQQGKLPDTVARLGGDEFTVIVSDITDTAGAETVARKIIETIATPFEIKAQETRIGASIGVSVFPEHGKDTDTLLKKADDAMYLAKQQGKNDYRVAKM